MAQSVFFVYGQLIADAEVLFDNVADSIQTAISVGAYQAVLPTMNNRSFCHNTIHLFEVAFFDLEVRLAFYILIFKDFIYPLWRQLFVLFIGNMFYQIADFLTHFLWQRNAKVLFQNVVYATFTGLAVDTDNVRIVSSAHIHWVNRKIRDRPLVELFLFTPCHTFGNGILMGTGESGKYQITGIWLTFVNVHSGKIFIFLTDCRQVGEVKLRINAV